MGKAKHTPGPWAVRFFREGDPEAGFFVEAPKTDPKAAYNIEVLSDDSGYYPVGQRLADAKLVAAAPELLFQVQQAKTILEVIDPENPAIQQMEKVIKKATNGKN